MTTKKVSLPDRETHEQTQTHKYRQMQDKVILMCRYSSQATQKVTSSIDIEIHCQNMNLTFDFVNATLKTNSTKGAHQCFIHSDYRYVYIYQEKWRPTCTCSFQWNLKKSCKNLSIHEKNLFSLKSQNWTRQIIASLYCFMIWKTRITQTLNDSKGEIPFLWKSVEST